MINELNRRSANGRLNFTFNKSSRLSREETNNLQVTPSGEHNVMRTYMKEIGKTPLLTQKEEVELANLIKNGDQEARNRMIAANLRLVVKIAYDYNNYGLPILDLISEGNIGLIKAVERFDPTKGGKLSTYAAWWIKQSIKRALANQSKAIRLPVHLVDKIAKMRQITSSLATELDREPTDEEVAYAMGTSPNRVAHLKSVSVRPSSLDAPIGEDGDTSFGELIGDEMQSTPFENLQKKSTFSDIRFVMDSLEPRESEIIRLRFGLDGHTPLTLEEVGEKFAITRERVRQIQMMALHKMRRIMTEKERQRSQEEIHEKYMQQKRMEVLQEFFEEHTPEVSSEVSETEAETDKV